MQGSHLSDHQAYQALVELYTSGMTDEQWKVVCEDLKTAGLPIEQRHEMYLAAALAGDEAGEK